MSIVKWRIFCNTENAWSEGYLDESSGNPTLCFNNNTHSVNLNSEYVVETTEKLQVKLQREDTPTGGNYNSEGFALNVAANTTGTLSVSWPFPINVLSVHSQTNDSNLGDILNAITNPKTLVGITTEEILIGTNILTVNSTVIANAKVGFDLYIIDELVGRILSINTNNSTIILENNVSQTYNSGSNIYVELRIIRTHNLGYNSGNDFGAFNGNKYLAANTITNVSYTNNSNTEKKFCFSVEYLF